MKSIKQAFRPTQSTYLTNRPINLFRLFNQSTNKRIAFSLEEFIEKTALLEFWQIFPEKS